MVPILVAPQAFAAEVQAVPYPGGFALGAQALVGQFASDGGEGGVPTQAPLQSYLPVFAVAC
jgi:hypothetical protein